MKATPVADHQWVKVIKALAYSFVSGFIGGFALAITNALTSVQNGGSVNLTRAFVIGLIFAGVSGGINTILVTIKQIFTPPTEA